MALARLPAKLTKLPLCHHGARPEFADVDASLPLTMASAKRKAAPTAELYVACLDQLGQFGNQVFQYAFAVAYAELWGLRLRTPRWVGAHVFVGAAEPAQALTPLPPPSERVILADRVVLSHAGWKVWVESREPLASLVRASGAPLSGRTLRSRCPQVNAAAIAADGAAACASTGVEHVEACLASGGMLELWGFFQFDTRHFAPHAALLRAAFAPHAALRRLVQAALEELCAPVAGGDGAPRTLVVLHVRCADTSVLADSPPSTAPHLPLACASHVQGIPAVYPLVIPPGARRTRRLSARRRQRSVVAGRTIAHAARRTRGQMASGRPSQRRRW